MTSEIIRYNLRATLFGWPFFYGKMLLNGKIKQDNEFIFLICRYTLNYLTIVYRNIQDKICAAD